MFTRKAGSGMRKVRAVVCGNQLVAKETKEEVFAGGVDSIALRATLRKAAFEEWKVGTVDVKTAFLQAPSRRQRLLVVTPPKVFGQAGVTKPDERWLKALYGLNSSDGLNGKEYKYVDNMPVAAEETVMKGFMDRLQQ